MKKSISEAVERAEKEVHGQLKKTLGTDKFYKMMCCEDCREIVDKTVLQVAGVNYAKMERLDL